MRQVPSFRSLMDMPFLLPTVTFALIVILWQLATDVFAIPSYILPSPTRILGGFEQIDLARWTDHVWATLRIALIGYVLSIAISLPIAIALVRSKLLSRAFYPILVVIQSVPVVAIAPIMIVVLGSEDAPRIVITCLITFFPLVVSTATGLMATPEELIELSKSLRAPAWREITQIRIPYAVPYIFSALKISITLAVIGAVVAEFVAAEKGIGYFIQFSTSFFKLPEAWAGLVILVIMSLVLFQVVAIVQRVFFPWSLPKEGR
ncbi:ABC transporter permease [Rhizobium sullae]|uniref:NitT/TauT family transport system permease protein n=1 Tax=Rhizobium sullae TaxID=50338 RepID=A0A4V6P0S1_RHISU|nr:ABC transporter permease [Rhizobium sullae]TCU14735.1 NitT/TauT family transport system permease protein [Rhizobium sullae]